MSASEAFCVGVGAFFVDELLAGAAIVEPDEELAGAGAAAGFAAGAELAAGAGAAAGFDEAEELAAGAAIVFPLDDAVESLFFFLEDFEEDAVVDPEDEPLAVPEAGAAEDPPLDALPEADEPDAAVLLAAVPDFFDLFFFVVVEDVEVLELLEFWSLVELLWDQLMVTHNATNTNSDTPQLRRDIFLFKGILPIEIISRSLVRQSMLRRFRAIAGTNPAKFHPGTVNNRKLCVEPKYGQP
jgi:hypothetical protein